MTLTSDINICSAEDSTRECPTLHGKQHNLISEQTLGLHTYPPSSSILPNSHSDIGISSAEDSTRERPTLHGQQQKRGLWDIKNKTQRGMKSRHLTMIGMHPRNNCTVFSKPSFAQLLVVSSVQEYSWVQEACVYRVHFHIVAWSWRLSHQVRIDVRSCKCTSLLLCRRHIRLRYDDYSVIYFFLWLIRCTYNSFWLMHSCEMSSMYPVSGAFSTFGTRFVSPALGFTLGEFKLQVIVV